MGRPDRLPTDALTGIHVLVVDDDSDGRDLFRTVLRYCGALVTAVATASEALDALAVVVPDVLVTDIAMPGRDGFWLIDHVRALPHERGRNLAAIAVTAHASSHSTARAQAAGFQTLLGKPLGSLGFVPPGRRPGRSRRLPILNVCDPRKWSAITVR